MTVDSSRTATPRTARPSTAGPATAVRPATAGFAPATFDEQVARVLALDLPSRTGVGVRRLRGALAALRDRALLAEAAADPSAGTVPALLVVTRDWLPSDLAMGGAVWKGRPGRVEMTPTTPEDYRTIDEVELPEASAYLLLDVDTGADLQDVRPEDALVALRERGRTPLTIDEGVALLLHHPSILAERNAYSLLASRQPGSQRVPAVWTSFKAPRLGWCWDRNPHTWLGSASAAGRVGPAS
jgi:hypothetical protein